MVFRLLCGLFLVSAVSAAGEFTILHHPSSLVFKGFDVIKQSTLKEVYSAALGFSTEHFSNWQGFYIENPFNLPEAIVTVAVEGVNDIGQQKGHHFPLVTNQDESKVYNALQKRITERYPEQESNLVRVVLSEGLEEVSQYGIFKGIKSENPKHVSHKFLKLDIDEDREFLKEISLLNEIISQVEQGIVKQDYVPDVFWFQISGLHAVSDLHGPNSTETKEAKQLLQDAMLRLNDVFNKAYNGHVLVNVITSDATHTRLGRSILQTTEETPSNKTKYNLASYYNKDYPVIFNIILWFGVVMFFAILAICLATMNMDPGRDSIIYRMTSTRMKKDN